MPEQASYRPSSSRLFRTVRELIFGHNRRTAAGDFLDNSAEQIIAEIRIREFTAGEVGKRQIFKGPRNEFPIIHVVVQKHWIATAIWLSANRVREQMIDSDFTDKSHGRNGVIGFQNTA